MAEIADVASGAPLLRQRRSLGSYLTVKNFVRRRVVNTDPNDSCNAGGLQRCLSLWDLIAYGVGSTVGAGIFVTTGVVAREQAGPAIVLSFLFAGLASLLSAFCYSEFASYMPVAGSAYTYTYATLGEALGWFIGWNLTLEYSISAAAVARGWAGYVVDMLQSYGWDPPGWLNNYRINDVLSLSPLAVVVCGVCTFLLVYGIKDSARFNLFVTVLNVATLVFIIVFGSSEYVSEENWRPFFPKGFSGAFRGAGTVFFSYVGFDAVSTLAEEVRNPKRDMPLGIVGTLSISTLLYIGVSLTITGMVPYEHINKDAPLSNAFQHVGANWARVLIATISVSTLTATTLCSLLGQTRISYRMSHDGLLFSLFSRLGKDNPTPVLGTIVTGAFAAALGFSLTLGNLTNMISIGTLMAFSVVCGGTLVMRYQDPKAPARVPAAVGVYTLAAFLVCVVVRTGMPVYAMGLSAVPAAGMVFYFSRLPTQKVPDAFVCPWVPVLPCLGILVNIWLTVQLPLAAWIRVIIWTGLGAAIYIFYGVRHSTLNDDAPPATNTGTTPTTPPTASYGAVEAGEAH